MLIDGFAAPAFATNCWILASGDEGLVVDPGIDDPDVRSALDAVLARHRVQPVAVLATHGHLDHTFSIRPVCHQRGIPAFIHEADRAALANPGLLSGPVLNSMFGARDFIEPDDVRVVRDGDQIEIAGLSLTVVHAPGHTPGSVLFRFDSEAVVVTGDVLFQGSIGRTDLPGGSMTDMASTLRDRIAPLPDEFRVLPGHGPMTDMASERAHNAYLRAAVEGRLI